MIKRQGADKLRMPGAEEWITAAGVRVRCYRAGTGPPLLLLHGLGEAAAVWYGNVTPLAKERSVYAMDLPGHGASDKPDWSYTLEEGVNFLQAFLDVLGLERVSLIGNSMGGLLAMAFALEHPRRVDRLALEDSAGLGREVAWFLRVMSLPGLGEALARQNRKSVRWLLRRVFHSRSFATERLLELLYRERNWPGNKEAMLRMLRRGVSIAGMKPSVILTDRLRELQAPTLVFWGLHDAIFPVAHGQRAAELLPNGRLEVFKRCGHWPHIEANQPFNRLALDFLGQS